VAAGSLFLLCLSASSYHSRHGYRHDVRRHATPLFAVKSSSSSRSSATRQEDRKKEWNEKYLLLKRFQEREGDCKVPKSHTEAGLNLGWWVITQRQLNRKEKLDAERPKRLEEIGVEWGTIQESSHPLA
jgi:hypothetical protein